MGVAIEPEAEPDTPSDEMGLMTSVGFTVVIEFSEGPSLTTSQVVGPLFGYEHL